MNPHHATVPAPRRLAPLALLVLVSLVIAACSSSSDTASESSKANGSQVDLGAEVYASSCASCHGSDLQGTDRGPSHLSIVYEPNHHGDDAFRSAIASGAPQHHWSFGAMPPVTGLSADEIEAVITYIRLQQEEQGFTS